MPRGPKPKPKALPRSPLTDRAPSSLSPEGKRLYRALAADLMAEGYACQCDSRLVALAAQTQAHEARVRREVDALDSLLVVSREGNPRVHPLAAELRAVGAQLAGLYAQLLLTPRSRSASRMTEAQARTASAKTDSLEGFLDAA